MKRRNILNLIGASTALLTVSTFPSLLSLGAAHRAASHPSKCRLKLSPIPGVAYSDSALAFMERARFETPRQAIYGMKDPNIEFFIEYVSA
jgi:hypothetical protein